MADKTGLYRVFAFTYGAVQADEYFADVTEALAFQRFCASEGCAVVGGRVGYAKPLGEPFTSKVRTATCETRDYFRLFLRERAAGRCRW